ncbi:MAG: transaldolase family protein [Spirochaetes bacterium]|nr:transaldolase family protein [Spirochaetota bacterium]
MKVNLRERILEEKKYWEKAKLEELWNSLVHGQEERVRGTLLYFSTSELFRKRFDYLEKKYMGKALKSDEVDRIVLFRFLLNLVLDLRTFPAERKLLSILGEEGIQSSAQRALQSLETLMDAFPEEATVFSEEIKKTIRARLKAEGISDEGELSRMVDALWGKRIREYIENLVHESSKSNLRSAARSSLGGSLHTEIGNDYADFLDSMIRIGGTFATTNPVLIKLAWDINPSYWNQRVDQVICGSYSKKKLASLVEGSKEDLSDAIERINALVTTSVVEKNCRLLRPIFLWSEGKQGYVSLQVNPKAHSDSERMVKEAVFIYKELEKRLGGVPNVVIKVPSTAAGLEAAKKLTSKGIGVTVTLTFSLFQCIPFAEVLQGGNALVSYIAIMNGRLAFPVRDELKAKGVAGGIEAARWAGVEVARKAAYRLYSAREKGGLGVDPAKVKIMIASLRIYDDWIPDISELWGIPLITIFPNVRRAYDAHPRPLVIDALHGKTPDKDIELLLNSEIFRQAWWVPENGSMGKPERVLTLEKRDTEAVAAWKPVQETLTQFIGMYQEMSQMVRERMLRLVKE